MLDRELRELSGLLDEERVVQNYQRFDPLLCESCESLFVAVRCRAFKRGNADTQLLRGRFDSLYLAAR